MARGFLPTLISFGPNLNVITEKDVAYWHFSDVAFAPSDVRS